MFILFLQYMNEKSWLNSIMIASFFMFFDVNATKLNYNHAVRYLSSAIKDIKLYNRVYCTSFYDSKDT